MWVSIWHPEINQATRRPEYRDWLLWYNHMLRNFGNPQEWFIFINNDPVLDGASQDMGAISVDDELKWALQKEESKRREIFCKY